ASIRSIRLSQMARAMKPRTMNNSSARVGTRWTPGVSASGLAGCDTSLVAVHYRFGDIAHQFLRVPAAVVIGNGHDRHRIDRSIGRGEESDVVDSADSAGQ